MSLTARPSPAGRMPQYAPGISDPYGTRRGSGIHNGQDYFWLNADPAGTQRVLSAGHGTVQGVFWSAQMGGCVEVRHDGIPDVTFRYCHMPPFTVEKATRLVVPGQRVNPNTYFGPMGDYGTSSPNGQIHLHFEAWRGGVRIDPEPFFSTTAGGGGSPIIIDEEDLDMSSTKYLFTRDAGDGKPAYGIFGEQVPGGHRITRSSQTASAWGAMFGTEGKSGHGDAWKELDTTQWNVLLRESAVINEAWRAQFAAATVGDVTVNVDLDYDRLADAINASRPEPSTFLFTGTATPQD